MSAQPTVHSRAHHLHISHGLSMTFHGLIIALNRTAPVNYLSNQTEFMPETAPVNCLSTIDGTDT